MTVCFFNGENGNEIRSISFEILASENSEEFIQKIVKEFQR